MITCPICSYSGTKALVGIFPVRLCLDAQCSCVWGFWAPLAFWLQDAITPRDNGGWLLFTYEGSYLVALRESFRGCE